MSEAPAARLKLKAQILLGEEIAIGPGKADLLEAIERTGSISAAGRALGMSYRRTWLLVDTMNRCWKEPLVETVTGGSHGGGARLSTLGKRVLLNYRAVETHMTEGACSTPLDVLLDAIRPLPRPSQKRGLQQL
ncbi:MAG: winged helix-turn-helix domain-containing protein [Sphingomonadaceae bacterium]